MAIPFGFIISGVLAIKDIVTSFGGLKNSEEKFKKVEEFFHEQNKINSQQLEFNSMIEKQIGKLNKRVKRMEIILVIFSICLAGLIVYVFR